MVKENWSYLESAKTLVQALVLSKLDYFNSLIADSAQYQLDKLQCIKNMACRVVCQHKKFDHVANSIDSLHWLKVWECTVFKAATLVYKCKSDMAPLYLKDLLRENNHSSRTLRPSTSNCLTPQFFKSTLAFNGSFTSAGPRVWNALPTSSKECTTLNSFKLSLKTHLVNQSYHVQHHIICIPSHHHIIPSSIVFTKMISTFFINFPC